MDNSDRFDLLYKLLIVVVSGFGLLINFNYISVRSGILYFTIQSNLLCFVFYVFYLIFNWRKNLRDNDGYYLFKGMITSCISLTMVMYTIMVLMGDMHSYDGHLVECIFVHYITPILVILDYLLNDEKGRMKWNYPLIWSVSLVFYGLFYVVYVSAGGIFFHSTYAYSFLNPDKFGISGVLINCLVIYVCSILNNYVMLCYDQSKGRKKI